MSKKIKIMTISDMPVSHSGVAIQTRIMIESLLESNKFEVLSLGGAKRHDTMKPFITKKYGNKWRLIPVQGFGTQEEIKMHLHNYKPDILWFMTDPRYYEHLWLIEHEIRPYVPMVYYHVWDNYPVPYYNNGWYESNDFIQCISRVTHDVVRKVSPSVKSEYVPHTVNPHFFRKMSKEEILKQITNATKIFEEEKFTVFFNSRNFYRKMPGSLIMWFNTFLNNVGRDKARLIMHTNPNDPAGQPLIEILKMFNMTNGEVIFNDESLSEAQLATFYNLSDVTVQISDAEGFGLSVQESLACGTPVVATRTGGIVEQVKGENETFGVLIEPASQTLIGSRQVPYIFSDRISEDGFVNALKTMYNMDKKEREELGIRAIEHVRKNFNYANYKKNWVRMMEEVHDHFGSWDTRKNYSHLKLEVL